MHLRMLRGASAVSPSKAIQGRAASMGIELDRYSVHVAVVPHFVAGDKACPLVVLASDDLHAIDGEEGVLLAADRGNFAVVTHPLPRPCFSGLDANWIAHSGTGVGPVNDRERDQTDRYEATTIEKAAVDSGCRPRS
jgi:hypothetical protein